MTSTLSAELAATCNALGYYDAIANKYLADANTLETVKDLIRYLRRDDESHDIRRHLGETKVLQTDLLPLLKSYWEETDLFDVLLRLIVNLTTPPLMLWNEELPTEKIIRNQYLQIEDHLQNYKQAFADEGVWAVLSTRLSKILEIDYAERGDENSLIIERILIMIRNILYVPADAAEKRPDNDANVHDQVLWALHQSGMLDIILYITSTSTEHAYYMHILEILSFMLREQKPFELANAALQRSQTEKIRDEAELLAIRHRETNQRQDKVKLYNATRHSRFGGTFVVKSMKSISDNELIYHKPLHKLEAMNFDVDKKKPKTPKNRVPFVCPTSERRSAFSIRLFLKEFCVEFLNGAYNTLMYYVKDNLVRAKAQAHDESYYLWALRFFMEFNRCYKFEVKLVSETMSVQSFHYVQQQSETYFDMMSSDKKKQRQWSRRLHLAVLAYGELFHTLCMMDKFPVDNVRHSASVIKNNIFYVLEYREFILALLVNYDELKMSDVYLKDLIETQHIFIKMLESFCGRQGTVIVQKKEKRRKTKSNKKAPMADNGEQPVALNLEGRWDEAAPQITTVLNAGIDPANDVVPFDASSETPMEEQKVNAMIKVQQQLRNGDYESAIALLHAARNVWPENDSFGSNNMPPEEEFQALRDIFFADLGENNPKPAPVVENVAAQQEDEYDEEEEELYENIVETDFKFKDFITRLANPKIMRACGLALKHFENNSVYTNHCIIKLLHRVAFDCKLPLMVCQVSIFQTLQQIFAAKDLPQHKELVKFAIYIIRQFFKVAEINKKVFMEALFWKSKKDAYEIEFGYGSLQGDSSARAWSEAEEMELTALFREHQEEQRTDDLVDWIIDNLIDKRRTRKGVLKKMRELFLIQTAPKKSKIPAKAWSATDEIQLRELHEQYKDAMDPLGIIMQHLDIQRPKNRIIEKMLVMGLIQDRKEMYKKRGAKSDKSRPQERNGSDDDLVADSESDDDNLNSPGISSTASTSTQRPRNDKKSAKNKSQTGKTKQRKQAPASKAQLTEALIQIMNSDMDEALIWLKESLGDAIEDFEEGNNERIPLVPIMNSAVTAMDNPEFQQMLKAFGICEPFDEQESHWRIPPDLTVACLELRCELLQSAIDKTLELPPEQSAHPSFAFEEQESQSRENSPTNGIEDESFGSNASSIIGNNSFRRRKYCPRIVNGDASIESPIIGNKIPRGCKIIPLIENGDQSPSDESDQENTENNSKRTRSGSDTDSEKPSVKKRVVMMVSDDDDDVETPRMDEEDDVAGPSSFIGGGALEDSDEDAEKGTSDTLAKKQRSTRILSDSEDD